MYKIASNFTKAITSKQWSIRQVLLILLGAAWAVNVYFSYFSVDNNFIWSFLKANFQPIMPVFSLSILCAFASALLLGYISGRHSYYWALLGLLVLYLLGYGVWVYAPPVRDMLQRVASASDALRSLFVIICAAAWGFGVGFGVQLSKGSLSLGFLVAVIAFPFLFVTLLAGAIAQLLTLVWLFLVAEAVGFTAMKMVCRLFKLSETCLDRPGVLTVAVGLGFLSLATLGLGLVGLASPVDLEAFLLIATVLFFKRIQILLVRTIQAEWNRPMSFSVVGWAALMMLTALFILFWIGALAPENGSDALGLRMATPAIWLREGRIAPLPEMTGSYGAAAGELIYLLVMPFDGAMAAKIVTFGLAVLLLTSAYFQVFSSQKSKDLSLWFFAFWGSTITWWQMVAGFVDLTQAFFYYAVILALRFWLDDVNAIWLIVAGLLGATATMVKLNGAGALAIAGLVMLIVTLRQNCSLIALLKNGLFLYVPSLLVALPWLARSFLLTGNPIFPFGNQIFKSPLASAEVPTVSFGPGLAFPKVLTVPWDVFFQPGRFVELGTYHPFLLAIALLGIVGLIGIERKDLLWLWSGLLAGISWLVTEQNTRYSLYAVYLLSLAFALGMSHLNDLLTRPLIRRFLHGLVLTGLIAGFAVEILRPATWMWQGNSGPGLPTEVVLGPQSAADYLSAYTQTYTCNEWLNRNYGSQAKVWQVPPLRDHLYLTGHAFALPHGILPVIDPLVGILNSKDLGADYRRMLEIGFTHLMYSASSPYIANAPENAREGIFSPAFEKTYLQPVCADREVRLYRIRTTPVSNSTSLSGANLLKNADFDTLGSDNKPTGWEATGGVGLSKSTGETTLNLGPGGVVAQLVSVGEGRLYELDFEIKTETRAQPGYVQINWVDQMGRLRLFWKQAVSSPGDFATFRFLQTAPSGTGIAWVRLFGGPANMRNVHFYEIQP